MRIFVTGASGFIGGHIVETLARQHHEITAMSRSEKSREAISGFGATPVMCDLSTIESAHLQGCEVVVHCAAYVEEWGTREQFWSVNVEGTRRMLAMANAAGVERFIHLSTEAVVFDGHDLVDIDETRPYPKKQRYLYSETKAEAEKLVVAANRADFTCIVLRPRLVWGPREGRLVPAMRKMSEKKRWMWLDGGAARTSTTHVANLSRAVELAIQRGIGGQVYFIADEERPTLREFFNALAEANGFTLQEKSVPGAVARPLSRLVEGVWRLFAIKKTPPMTSFPIAMMSRTITVKTAKARAELMYEPTSYSHPQ